MECFWRGSRIHIWEFLILPVFESGRNILNFSDHAIAGWIQKPALSKVLKYFICSDIKFSKPRPVIDTRLTQIWISSQVPLSAMFKMNYFMIRKIKTIKTLVIKTWQERPCLRSTFFIVCVQAWLICDSSSDYLINLNSVIGGQSTKGCSPGMVAHACKPMI